MLWTKDGINQWQSKFSLNPFKPLLEMRPSPRTLILINEKYFSNFAYNPFSWSLLMIRRTCFKCFYVLLENIKMSSKNHGVI